MEIYYNSPDFIEYTVYDGKNTADPPGGVTFTVTDSETGEVIDGLDDKAAVPEGDGVYITKLPPFTDYRTKEITWTYDVEGVTHTTEPELVHIVRPYITLSMYNSQAFDMERLSPIEFKQLESVVRNVIDSYCRQDFQLESDTKVVPGGSTNVLQLPARLASLNNIAIVNEAVTAGFGYEGEYGDDSEFERARVDSLSLYSLNEYVTFDPGNPWQIRRRVGAEHPGRNPTQRYEFFANGRLYAIDGEWGWKQVPPPVQQAAAILVRDYLDDDSKWREKYVGVVRAADWRMEFFATGNETTGNANADMILERYRNYRWEVV